MEIEGTVAVVTGGANGIGRATAIALANAGADVVVSDIDEDGGHSAAVEIEAAGRKALTLRTDVGRREDVEDLVARAIEWQGRVDLFVSNAGVGSTGSAHEFAVDEWERILAIDLMASIWAMRLVVAHMLERNTGHISFVASGWGFEGSATAAPYCVAKFGLVGLAESLARQLKDKVVEVSLIVPGAVASNVSNSYVVADSGRVGPDGVARIRDRLYEESRNWATPESMAATVVEGIRAGRFYIAQKHPVLEDWIADNFRKRAEDPEGYVLG